MVDDDPLWAAIRAANARWSPGALDRFPVARRWEPSRASTGNHQAIDPESISAAVPSVPTVPTKKEDIQTRTGDTARDVTADEWAERAAILEFDAGLSREEAERRTFAELGPPP